MTIFSPINPIFPVGAYPDFSLQSIIEAKAIQKQLREKVITQDCCPEVSHVVGLMLGFKIIIQLVKLQQLS